MGEHVNARNEKTIRPHTKGRKHLKHELPTELRAKLTGVKPIAKSLFVVTSPRQEMMSYDGFLKALKRYCKEAGVTVIATHGLRHSTSGLYRAFGASNDDMTTLLGQGSKAVTERYLHDKGEHVYGIGKVIRLFPEKYVSENLTKLPCSTNVPCGPKTEVDPKDGIC